MSAPRLSYFTGPLRRRLEDRPDLRAALANSGWLIADRMLRMLLAIVVGAWVARYLGPEQFGELAYVLAFVAFFQALSLLGLDGLTVRDIARDSSQAAAVLGTVFRLRLAAASVGWLTACGLIQVLRPGDTATLVLVAIVAAGMLFQTADVIDLWFQSQTQSRRSVVAKAIAYLLANGAKVALVMAEAPLSAFALVQLLDTGFAAVFLTRAYCRFRPSESWRWDSGIAKSLVRQCWPFIISGLAVATYMRIDQIMLRELAGERELGYYVAALLLSQAWAFIPLTIVTSISPMLARMHKEDRTRYNTTLQSMFDLMVWLAMAIAIPVALVSPWLVSLLYGQAFEPAAAILALHVFSILAIFLGVGQSLWILNEGRPAIALYKAVLGALASVGLNFLLIPNYGAFGAAASSVISYSLSAVLANAILCPDIFRMQIRAFVPRAVFNVT